MRSSLQREAGSQKLGPVSEVKIELVKSPGSAVAEELDGGGAEPLHRSRPSLCCKTFIIHHFLVVVVNEVGLGADKLSLLLFPHLELFSFRSRSLGPHCSEHSALLIVSKETCRVCGCLGALAAVPVVENNRFCLFIWSLYFSRLSVVGFGEEVCGVQQGINSPRALWVGLLSCENNSVKIGSGGK